MKRILPKGSGVSQIGGIFTSPRTTIILAPARPTQAGVTPLPIGASLSSPLILPAPPTSTITLAAHRVPQPTPVILPLTKNTSSSSGTIQLQGPPLAPKNPSHGKELKDQRPNINYLGGKRTKGQSLKKNKDRRNGRKIQTKNSNFEMPILPKKSEADSPTVILVHSGAGKAVTLSTPVLAPKCSMVNVITNDTHSHSVCKEGKETTNKEKVKKKNQGKLPQRNHDKPDSEKSSGQKHLKKRYTDKSSITVIHEANKIEPLAAHQDGIREGSSLHIGKSSMCSPESFILSPEGCLNPSSHPSPHQGVPHHPPPPYPQDLVDDVTSHSEGNKSTKDTSQVTASGHVRRKKSEWKVKRHNIGERSDFSKITDVEDSHTSSSHLITRCSQPRITSTSSPVPSLNIPAGKRVITNTTTVTSSCSSVSHSQCFPSKNKNTSSSKLHSDAKCPPELHTCLSVSSQPQVLSLTPTKSNQKNLFEDPYPFSSSSDVCVAGVPSGSSLQLISQSTQCSQKSLTHPSQCASSLSLQTTNSGPACHELKSVTSAASSQPGLQCTISAQSSPHSQLCDQVQSSGFYFHSPQCNTSLQSVSQIHSSISTEPNPAIAPSFPSYMSSQDQTFDLKVTSHSSTYTDSSQTTSYAHSLQSYMSLPPPPLNSYTEVPQTKLITKSPHPSQMSSHQLPSYTQSSESSSTQSAETPINTLPDHVTSQVLSPPTSHGHSHSPYTGTQHPHPCLHSEHFSYLPTRSLSLDGQHGKMVPDHNFSQGISFSSEYATSYSSPEAGSHSQPPHTPIVENLSIAMFKDNSQSPVLTLYASPHDSSAQCYMDSSNVPYASQTNPQESHYYNQSKFKTSTSSSVDPTSPHLILEKSLNPPSYEAHIQNTASYFASENSKHLTQDSQHHQKTSPANYSMSCHLVRDQEGPQIDHSIIANITQGTYDYEIEESSQTYFPPSPDTQLLPSENQPQNIVEYTVSHNLSESHSTNSHIASHCVQNNVQPRLQNRTFVYPPTRQEPLYKNDDLNLSTWSNGIRSTADSDNLRIDKLFFIPQSEQTHLYMKKDSSKNLSSDPGLQLSKDVMLKKFWIEEDEPLAEEIVSLLPGRLPPPQTSPKNNNSKQMLCQICGKMLKGRSSLKCHLNSHHNIQPHSCSTCGKSFSNRTILVEHLRIHSGEKPYSCNICDAVFRTRSGLLRHGSLHTLARPHECSVCSKKFKTKLVLRQHMKLHQTGIFTCSECGKTFERHKSLAAHKAFHHHKTQRFKCPHCPRGYHFQSLLNQHMQLHSNVYKYTCSICRKSFVWRSGLAAHMKTHSASRPKCDICDLSFASEKRLKSHYQRHCNSKPHQCKVCGRCFSHAYRLASHSLVHQEHREYICYKCDIMFTNAKKFRKHLVTHKKEETRSCNLSSTIEISKPIL